MWIIHMIEDTLGYDNTDDFSWKAREGFFFLPEDLIYMAFASFPLPRPPFLALLARGSPKKGSGLAWPLARTLSIF